MQTELFKNDNTKKFPQELILLRKLWIESIKARRKTLDGYDINAWYNARKTEMVIFDVICRRFSKDFKVFSGIEWWLCR